MISHRDEILPYALRLGVRPSGEAPEIPAHYWRTVKRMEFSPKTLINIDYFRERVLLAPAR